MLEALAPNELDHVDRLRVASSPQVRVGRACLEERLAHRRRDGAAIAVDAQVRERRLPRAAGSSSTKSPRQSGISRRTVLIRRKPIRS